MIDPVVRASAGAADMVLTVGPVNFDGNPGPARRGIVQPDMTFSLGAWPGIGRLNVSPSETWVIKSIHLNGADITNTPIDFAEGHEIKGLEVEVVRRTAGRGAGPSTR